MSRVVEVALFALTCHDGGEPDAEHDDAITRFERESLTLDELNAILFRCRRPARAFAVPSDDPDYHDDLEALEKANKS